ARRFLIAKLREITLILCGGVTVIRWCDGVEARLLLVAEGLVEALQGRTHSPHGREHDLQPTLHRRNPPGRCAWQVIGATTFENVDGLLARRAQFIERRALRLSRLHDLGNALDGPVGELRGVIAANFRSAAALHSAWSSRRDARSCRH